MGGTVAGATIQHPASIMHRSDYMEDHLCRRLGVYLLLSKPNVRSGWRVCLEVRDLENQKCVLFKQE